MVLYIIYRNFTTIKIGNNIVSRAIFDLFCNINTYVRKKRTPLESSFPVFQAAFFWVARIRNRTATRIAAEAGRTIQAFWTKPARI